MDQSIYLCRRKIYYHKHIMFRKQIKKRSLKLRYAIYTYRLVPLIRHMKGLSRRVCMIRSRVNDKTKLEISYKLLPTRSLRLLSFAPLPCIYGKVLSLKKHRSRVKITMDGRSEKGRRMKRGEDNKPTLIGVLCRRVTCAYIYIDDHKGRHFL